VMFLFRNIAISLCLSIIAGMSGWLALRLYEQGGINRDGWRDVWGVGGPPTRREKSMLHVAGVETNRERNGRRERPDAGRSKGKTN
jgi:hypothetical protein